MGTAIRSSLVTALQSRGYPNRGKAPKTRHRTAQTARKGIRESRSRHMKQKQVTFV
jgi:hypothetical protein